MNIALTTLVVIFLLIPGILFRAALIKSEALENPLDTSFKTELIIILICAIPFQLAGYWCVSPLLDAESHLIFGELSDFFFPDANANSGETHKLSVNFVIYNSSLSAVALLTGYFLRKYIILPYFLDLKFNSFLSISNEWDNILSGRLNQYTRIESHRSERKSYRLVKLVGVRNFESSVAELIDSFATNAFNQRKRQKSYRALLSGADFVLVSDLYLRIKHLSESRRKLEKELLILKDELKEIEDSIEGENKFLIIKSSQNKLNEQRKELKGEISKQVKDLKKWKAVRLGSREGVDGYPVFKELSTELNSLDGIIQDELTRLVKNLTLANKQLIDTEGKIRRSEQQLLSLRESFNSEINDRDSEKHPNLRGSYNSRLRAYAEKYKKFTECSTELKKYVKKKEDAINRIGKNLTHEFEGLLDHYKDFKNYHWLERRIRFVLNKPKPNCRVKNSKSKLRKLLKSERKMKRYQVSRVQEEQVDFLWVEAILEINNEITLYRGKLKKYYLAKNNSLSKIVLHGTKRRKIVTPVVRASDKPNAELLYQNFPSSEFVIPFEHIVNLNVIPTFIVDDEKGVTTK